MLRNLHITDISPASGHVYNSNRQWCLDNGAVVHPQPVSAFDYKHMLRKTEAPAEFDMIVCFGLCFNTFYGSDGLAQSGTNSSINRQYKCLSGTPHQQIFSEVLFGQSITSTQVLIHTAKLASFVSPRAMNFPLCRGRMFNPTGERRLQQLMGGNLRPSGEPLMVNITGPGVKAAHTHMVTTQSEEIQIDVQSMMLTTLQAGGSVLVLGAGQMRLLRTLAHSAPLEGGMPIIKPTYGPITSVTKHVTGRKRTYFGFCLTTGHADGTAEHDEDVVGRVNLKRLKLWCDCTVAGAKSSV